MVSYVSSPAVIATALHLVVDKLHQLSDVVSVAELTDQVHEVGHFAGF